ncbi:hypothetical protein L486_05145 [Kwoniella mangroviensis CBS 10435]|uniref:Uncharacterized protein n=1 Tax=Kwoniella mangroviensis CBS 10435 TaxID=1331196 RepID=A0A1B9IQ56_9TREE|nr:hypothetical protein L486_05145 [Kwoniella mangroviensis CBS 10435]
MNSADKRGKSLEGQMARAGIKDLPNELLTRIVKEVQHPQDHLNFFQSCYSIYETYRKQNIFKIVCINLGFSLSICHSQSKTKCRRHGVNKRNWRSLLHRLIRHAERCGQRDCVNYCTKVLPKEWQLQINKQPILNYQAYTGPRQLNNFISTMGNVTLTQFCTFRFQFHTVRSSAFSQDIKIDRLNDTILYLQDKRTPEGINLLGNFSLLTIDKEDDSDLCDWRVPKNTYHCSLWDHPLIENSMATYPPTQQLWLSIAFNVDGQKIAQTTYLGSKEPLTVQDVILSLCCLMNREPNPGIRDRLINSMFNSILSSSFSQDKRQVADMEKIVDGVKNNRDLMAIDFDGIFNNKRYSRDQYISVEFSNRGPENMPLLTFTSVFL